MTYEYQGHRYLGNITSILVGVLVGGMAGVVAMLLLAPQSGKDTRRQIREKGIELRDRTSEIVEDTLAQARTSTKKVTMDVRNHGQKFIDEQLEDAAEALQAGKKAVGRS